MELLRDLQPVRHRFADGSWVDLKPRLTFAERKSLASAAISAVPDGAGQLRPKVDVSAGEMAGLVVGILAWSLAEPLTPENIALLDEETGNEIKAVLDAMWRPRTDDERKNSLGAGAPPIAEDESPQSSAG